MGHGEVVVGHGGLAVGHGGVVACHGGVVVSHGRVVMGHGEVVYLKRQETVDSTTLNVKKKLKMLIILQTTSYVC